MYSLDIMDKIEDYCTAHHASYDEIIELYEEVIEELELGIKELKEMKKC